MKNILTGLCMPDNLTSEQQIMNLQERINIQKLYLADAEFEVADRTQYISLLEKELQRLKEDNEQPIR